MIKKAMGLILTVFDDKKNYWLAWLVFCLSLLAFCISFKHEFVQFDSRFALFAQEMLRNGPSFFPTVYQQYYPDYPATQTLLIYLLSKWHGQLTWLTGIFPNALAGASTLVLIYLIAVKHSRLWAISAVLLAICSWQFLATARSLALDQFTALATTLAFYVVYSSRRNVKQLIWLLFALLLGFLFRGPIGLVIPASVIGGFYLLEGNIKQLICMMMVSMSLLLLSILGLLLAARYTAGEGFAKAVLFMQVVGRIKQLGHYPFYYYFTQALIGYFPSFPLAIGVIIGLRKELFNYPVWQEKPTADRRLIRHLVFWLLIVFLGLSIPSEKKLRYLLPLLPAAALLAGSIFHHGFAIQLSKLRDWVVKFCLLLPWLGLMVTMAAQFYCQYQHITVPAYFKLTAFVMGLLVLGRKTGQINSTLAILLSATFAFLCFNLLVIEPLIIDNNTLYPFLQQLQALRKEQQALAFYRIGPDAEDIKLMVALDEPLTPIFIKSPAVLASYLQQPVLIITHLDELTRLPNTLEGKLQIKFTGKIGHQVCVVFASKV